MLMREPHEQPTWGNVGCLRQGHRCHQALVATHMQLAAQLPLAATLHVYPLIKGQADDV